MFALKVLFKPLYFDLARGDKMSVFELGMLICFGFAWPISIYRSYKSRSTKGKSPVFSIVVLIGYMSGITHKLLYSYDFVLFAYILNFVMVFIDLMLWFRNRAIEKRMQED
jgi:hypothetical protein